MPLQAEDPEFQTDDFAVVAQPFTHHLHWPLKGPNLTDFSYMAPDCFHFSQRGYARGKCTGALMPGLESTRIHTESGKSVEASLVHENIVITTSILFVSHSGQRVVEQHAGARGREVDGLVQLVPAVPLSHRAAPLHLHQGQQRQGGQRQ